MNSSTDSLRHRPALPSLRVRPATAADAALLADIHTRSRAATYRGVLPDTYLDGSMVADSLSIWQEKLRAFGAGAGRAYVAESGGVPLAFVAVITPDDETGAYIDNLHAYPDRKGGGAGTALLDAATSWSRGLGATHMHLRVLDTNQAAIGFYEARGWRRLGHIDDVMGGTPVGAFVYGLDIA